MMPDPKEERQRDAIKDAAERMSDTTEGRLKFIEDKHPNLKQEHKDKIKKDWEN